VIDPRPPTPAQVYRQLAEYLDRQVQADKERAGGEPSGSGALYLLQHLEVLAPGQGT
jgi:hypothetical protein